MEQVYKQSEAPAAQRFGEILTFAEQMNASEGVYLHTLGATAGTAFRSDATGFDFGS